jgi:hypothetical protein
MIGMPSPQQLRDLINQIWTGHADDAHARFILADAYDDLGRRDVAMLWRDELPNYRRRKRVPKLTDQERGEVRRRKKWWRENVVVRTGPSDEDLALAAIAALYRTNPITRNWPLPQVIWTPSPLITAKWSSSNDDTMLVPPHMTGLTDAITQSTSTEMYSARTDPEYTYFIDVASMADSNATIGLRSGLAYGQFGWVAAEMGIFLDILRMDMQPVHELYCRAGIGLAHVTPYYAATHTKIWLSQHPFTIDDHQARWAWLDGDNRPHQWPSG